MILQEALNGRNSWIADLGKRLLHHPAAFASRMWLTSTTGRNRHPQILDDHATNSKATSSEFQTGKWPWLTLIEIAPEGKAQSRANFPHPPGTQLCNSPPQSILRNGNRVVQVHRTRSFHSILLVQNYFRGHATNGRCDGCDGNRREIGDSTVAG